MSWKTVSQTWKAAGPEAPAQHSTPPEALRAPDNPTPLLLLPYQRSLPVLLLFKVMTDCINVPSARNFELGKENKCWLRIWFCLQRPVPVLKKFRMKRTTGFQLSQKPERTGKERRGVFLFGGGGAGRGFLLPTQQWSEPWQSSLMIGWAAYKNISSLQMPYRIRAAWMNLLGFHLCPKMSVEKLFCSQHIPECNGFHDLHNGHVDLQNVIVSLIWTMGMRIYKMGHVDFQNVHVNFEQWLAQLYQTWPIHRAL